MSRETAFVLSAVVLGAAAVGVVYMMKQQPRPPVLALPAPSAPVVPPKAKDVLGQVVDVANGIGDLFNNVGSLFR